MMNAFEKTIKDSGLRVAEFNRQIRATVDAGGWNAVRENLGLWRLEQLRRADSHQWVNQNIDREVC